MNILRHRPLFLCCAAFLAAAALSRLLAGDGRMILAFLLLFGGGVGALCLWLCRRDRYRALLTLIACVLACVAVGESHMTFDGEQTRRLEALTGETVVVEAVVTDYRGSGETISSFELSLMTVDGVATEGLAVLTCHYAAELEPGNVVRLPTTVVPLEEVATDRYGVDALTGDGFTAAFVSEEGESASVIAEESDSLLWRLGATRRTLAARLNLLTGQDAGGLPSALLLGDRSELADAVRRDFSRGGVSHLLAISGLHMTLLFGLLDGFLRFLRVPKRGRAVLLGVSALGYLALIGFPPSATRAVIMLGVTYLSHLLSEQADPLTSLGVAGALIVMITPYAVADAGFWMSFFAALGLITLSPVIQERVEASREKERFAWARTARRLMWRVGAPLLVGIVAMSVTLSLVAAVIGEVGILSPILTAVLTPLCALLLVLSILCLLLFATPLGALIGGAAELVSTAMIGLTSLVTKPAWVVVSLRHEAVLPLALLMTAAILLLLIIRLPAGRRALVLLPILLGWVMIGGVLTVNAALTRRDVKATFVQPSSRSDALVLVAGQRGMICDLSNGSLSSLRAAMIEAEEQGATELSVLMLTHYHSRTTGALSVFLQSETVRALWLPVPRDEEEYDLLMAYLEKASLADVPVCLYEPGEELAIFGEGSLRVLTTEMTRSTHPVMLVSLDVSRGETGRDRLTYCGSAVFESDLAETAARWVKGADVVVLGNHGPLVKFPFGEEMDLSETETVILSAHGDVAAYLRDTALPDGVSLLEGKQTVTLKGD